MQYNQNHEFVAHRNIRNPHAPTAATAAAFMPLDGYVLLVAGSEVWRHEHMCVYVFF